MSRIPVVSACVLVGAALVSLAVPSAAHAQEGGALIGTLFDQQTRQPLPGGTITVEDLGLSTQSGQDGSFTLSDLPSGPLTLRLSATGFATGVEQVELNPGETVFHQFAVLPLGATIGEVLVLAGRSRQSLDSSVEISGEADGVAWTAADLLAQRVPGLSFSSRSGNVGSGATITIRGISTFTQSSDPIIFLDGIRLGQSSSGPRTSGGENPLNVLDAIPASDVKRIRVMRGSSAAAAYGDSANGVIVIETRDEGE